MAHRFQHVRMWRRHALVAGALACAPAGAASAQEILPPPVFPGLQVPPPGSQIPPRGKRAATPPIPKGNPGAWVETSDHPPSALREEGEGVVRFSLTVDNAGVPVNCTVTQSSGRADLDEAACRLISERARFDPAKNAKGKPVAGTYSNSVRWQIPRVHTAPSPGALVTAAVVEKDGSVSSCTVEVAQGAFESGRERACERPGSFDPIVDANGNPVRKRIRVTMKIEYEDLP